VIIKKHFINIHYSCCVLLKIKHFILKLRIAIVGKNIKTAGNLIPRTEKYWGLDYYSINVNDTLVEVKFLRTRV